MECHGATFAILPPFFVAEHGRPKIRHVSASNVAADHRSTSEAAVGEVQRLGNALTNSTGSNVYWCAVKVREVIAELESDGWQLVRTRGSHRQFRHPSKPGTVTVAGKLSVDVPPGTRGSIWKQAGLKKS